MATSASREAKTDPKGGKADPKAKDPKARLEEHAPPVTPAHPRKKRSRGKLASIVILVLAVAGGGVWYLLQGEEAAAVPAKTAKARPAKAAPQQPTKPPTFLPLDPFTVNLRRENDSQYLQVGLTLRLTDSDHADAIKARMPEVRNRVLLLLSGKTASELATLEGKQALSAEIQKEVMAALGGSVPAGGLSGVLFTSFLIQ